MGIFSSPTLGTIEFDRCYAHCPANTAACPQIVKQVNPAGIIATLAGTGDVGYVGNGGPATAATVCNPYSVAVSSNGDVYIADLSNNRVGKVRIYFHSDSSFLLIVLLPCFR